MKPEKKRNFFISDVLTAFVMVVLKALYCSTPDNVFGLLGHVSWFFQTQKSHFGKPFHFVLYCRGLNNGSLFGEFSR